MLFRFLFFSAITFITVSCNNNNNTYKGNLIPRDTIIVIIAEFQIADALQAHYALNQMGKSVDQGLVYLSILKKHSTDRESFAKTITYYTRNIEEFAEINKEVTLWLEEEKNKLTNNDSLSVVK